MISEVTVTLGRSDRKIVLPVTILDGMRHFTISFGKERYTVGFVDGYLVVGNLITKDSYVVRDNNGKRVRRVGTDVTWE